ncbi:Cbp1 family collagen-binding glycoprotein adhesin [Prevotella veroralis]
MKRIKITSLIVFAGLVACTSCEDVKRPAPKREAINVTPPSRENEAISQLTASIDEISDNLDLISSQEAMLCKTTEHANKKSKIIQQIKGLGTLLAEKQKQIDKLLSEKNKQTEVSSDKSGTIEKLYKMIEFLASQLKEKGARMAELEAVANRKDVSVDQLKYIVLNQSNSVDALRYKFDMSVAEDNKPRVKAVKREEQPKEVFYIIADKQTLKDKGLLKTTLFSKKINNNNITEENFVKGNRNELTTLTIKSTSPKILSPNPESSYRLTTNEDGTTTLTITNVDKFWNVSRYLIIQE